MTIWTHDDIEDAANALDDNGYGSLGDEVRSLLEERDRLVGAVRDVIAMLDEYDLDMTAAEDPQLLVTLCSTAHRDLSAAIGCNTEEE